MTAEHVLLQYVLCLVQRFIPNRVVLLRRSMSEKIGISVRVYESE